MSKYNIISESGLEFFGLISASVSHDIKNILAIINEKAGLIDDFILMSEKGSPLNPERIKIIIENITKQVQRANGIVNNINKFAHSVDNYVKIVELNEILNLVIKLSSRLIAMRNVNLEIRHTEEMVNIRTSPFFLKNLIWLCLDFALNAAGSSKTIGINAIRLEKTAKIQFNQLDNLTNVSMTFPTEKETALLNILHADLTTDQQAKELLITLPGDINSLV